jgi:tripartite-type tricarboxylate transporter receptor subunit TctC
MGIDAFRRPLIAAAALLVLAICGPAAWPAYAASPADFYKGRTVQLVVGFTAGGGYDLYARVLARHMGKHIPGNPSVVTQNMPGAGSLKTANYLYNVAPKDGSVFGTFDRGLPMEKLLGRTNGQDFDATKFTWIGSVTDEPSVCGFSSKSGIRSWQDMKTKPFKVGGAGATADDEIYPTVLRNMFHLPVRIVSGYPGRAEAVLSIQRGEIDGLCGWSWSSLMSRDKYLLDNKQLYVALQLGVEKNLDLAGVPLIGDLTDDPKQKAALKLIFSRLTIARPFAAPPGLPGERATALREAFDATMNDAEFLAEMKRLALEVRPQSGAKVEQLVKEVYTYPADVVKIATQAIGPAR